MKNNKLLFIGLVVVIFLVACASKSEIENTWQEQNKEYAPLALSQEFKEYWYAGQAEINSFSLKQERYGSIHEGQSVLIFVTEPFSSKKQVKADRYHESNVPVLKLNQTKKFVTGVYPYATMLSTFSPLTDQPNAIKTVFTSQEWCGQSFVQLNNRDRYEIDYHSYFESNGDNKFALNKELLEDDIWNKIRINPDDLPQGKLKMIPSMEFLVLHHKEVKAYEAKVLLKQVGEENIYSIEYPTLKRTLNIHFGIEFPYPINGWEESKPNGLKTVATKLKTMRLDYWSKHTNEDLPLRDSLMLK